MQASEALVMPSWLKIIKIKNTVETQNVRPRGVRIKNLLPCATQDVHPLKRNQGILQGISWNCTHFVVEQQSQQLFWQIRNLSRVFSQRKHFHHHCGMHETMYSNWASRWHTSPVQSTLQLTNSPDWNSNSRKGYVSKSEKVFKQLPLRWQHLPRTS